MSSRDVSSAPAIRLLWLSLVDFRSHSSLEWRPSAGVNLLVGPNGSGKTSLLEAIGYLSSLSSFRGAPDDALPAFDAPAAVIRGEVAVGDSTSLIEVEIRRRGGRRAFVDRQRVGRTADLLGRVRTVSFLPDDLDLVKRGPSERRNLLDGVAVQLWPGSYLEQSELDRALRQRNAFLRQGGDDDLTLDVWDERVAAAGGKVLTRRLRAARALAGPLAETYRAVSGTDGALAVSYSSTWAGEADASTPPGEITSRLREALRASRRTDRERRLTSVGPHRDDPTLVLSGRDLRYFGSQGEQRTAALSLRLASHAAVSEVAGVAPLLLLDDVFSELDAARAAALTRHLPAAQIFVTTTHPEEVPLEGSLWAVRPGAVTP